MTNRAENRRPAWRSPGAFTYPGRNLVHELAVDTVDYHTGGEPFRIVAESPVPIPGDCVADRRARAIADPAVDGLLHRRSPGSPRARVRPAVTTHD
jgi:hypothetical protein